MDEHYEEASVRTNELNPNWDMYMLLDQEGHLGMYTARNPEGELVGYMVVVADNSLHSKETCIATTDSLYIRPEDRTPFAGLRFLSYVERDLASKGITSLSVASSERKPIGNLLSYMGFDVLETVYYKEI